MPLSQAQIDAILAAAKSQIDALFAGGDPIHVHTGDNLQHACDVAPTGATLLIDPGAYEPLTLTKPLTLQSSATLPGRRIRADDPMGLFVRVPHVMRLAPASLVGLQIGSQTPQLDVLTDTFDQTGTLVTALTDQCVIDGRMRARRGVTANAAGVTYQRCWIGGAYEAGTDSQGLCGWDGTRTVKVLDCYVEGATECLLIGGADPRDQAHTPTDVEIGFSTLSRPAFWKGQYGPCKNTLEVKNVTGVHIHDCIIENSWAEGQGGTLLLLTARNQDGTAPWSTVAHVLIEHNHLRNGAGGIAILGLDDEQPSGRVQDITIRQNRIDGLDPSLWRTTADGSGLYLGLTRGSLGLTFDHNTCLGVNMGKGVYCANDGDGANPQLVNSALVVTNNIFGEPYWGVFGGDNHSPAAASLYFAPNATFTNNAVIEAPSDQNHQYPLLSGWAYVPDEAHGIAQGAGATGYPQ